MAGWCDGFVYFLLRYFVRISFPNEVWRSLYSTPLCSISTSSAPAKIASLESRATPKADGATTVVPGLRAGALGEWLAKVWGREFIPEL
jgi:hypothetical protein